MLLWDEREEREAIADPPKYGVSLTTNSQETTKRSVCMNKIKKGFWHTDSGLDSFLDESGDIQQQLSVLPESYEGEIELEIKLGIV